jgi:hypothetical protein
MSESARRQKHGGDRAWRSAAAFADATANRTKVEERSAGGSATIQDATERSGAKGPRVATELGGVQGARPAFATSSLRRGQEHSRTITP